MVSFFLSPFIAVSLYPALGLSLGYSFISTDFPSPIISLLQWSRGFDWLFFVGYVDISGEQNT